MSSSSCWCLSAFISRCWIENDKKEKCCNVMERWGSSTKVSATFGAKPSDWNIMVSSPGESIIMSWGGEVGRGAEEYTSVARVVSFMGDCNDTCCGWGLDILIFRFRWFGGDQTHGEVWEKGRTLGLLLCPLVHHISLISGWEGDQISTWALQDSNQESSKVQSVMNFSPHFLFLPSIFTFGSDES